MTIALEDALLSGVPIGAGQTCMCDVCGQTLRPNDRVEVLVLFGSATVDLVTTRGECCARGELHPQTARPCWLVCGRLAGAIGPNDRSQVILSGASVVDRSE